ncbi:hypothetical protein CDV36_009895 [Fusarium kuroshium]|uniref:Uncharacterized protein n=2 Tax=Fusarium solani species complex TaxID=232080 RepID=A0A3M2RYU5_9HYPO|nr:hypothetical protein CDV36_009895 [Fusarium kuroshium]
MYENERGWNGDRRDQRLLPPIQRMEPVGRPVAAELGRRGTDTGSYGKRAVTGSLTFQFFFNIHPQYDTIIPSPFSGSSDFSSEQGRLHLNDLLLSFANSADEQALASPADVCGVGGLAPEG